MSGDQDAALVVTLEIDRTVQIEDFEPVRVRVSAHHRFAVDADPIKVNERLTALDIELTKVKDVAIRRELLAIYEKPVTYNERGQKIALVDRILLPKPAVISDKPKTTLEQDCKQTEQHSNIKVDLIFDSWPESVTCPDCGNTIPRKPSRLDEGEFYYRCMNPKCPRYKKYIRHRPDGTPIGPMKNNDTKK